MCRILVFIALIFTCFSVNSSSQVNINTITKLNNDLCIFTESQWYQDTLFILGTSALITSGLKGTLVKYSKDGIFSNAVNLLDTSDLYSYGFWDKGLLIQNDTIFCTAQKSFSQPEQVEGVILNLNTQGKIIKSNSFKSYYFPNENLSVLKDFKKLSDGYIVTDHSWRNSNSRDGQSCLIRLDRDLNKVWRYCYGDLSSEDPSQVFQLTNGHFIVIANSTDLDITEMYQGAGHAFFRGYIFETDEEGNLKWEWRSPDRSESTYAAVLENDTTLIVASGLGIEKCTTPNDPNSNCYFVWTGGAYKFNIRTREKEWETRLSGGPSTAMFDNRYLDIIPSIEKDGYILCGAGYEKFPDCRIDTIDKCWANPGIIAKVSNEGDSLWLRKYFGVTDISEANTLYDVEITPDSGYSFVGEAFNPWPGELQGQHGWLLITDKYGCLVPGCQLISGTSDPISENSSLESPIKIYPNPASDMINVLIRTNLSSKATLHLLDEKGHELDSWHTFEKGATYIIPTDDLIPGIYIMTLTDGGNLIESEKIIIN